MKLHNQLIAAAILVSQTSVAEAAERRRLDIPAGRLGDAVVTLGRQAGISIGVADPMLMTQPVPRVRGTLTIDQALRRLLRGSGAGYLSVDAQTYRIVRGPPPPQQARRAVRRASAPPAPLPPDPPEQEIVVTGSKRPITFGDYPGPVEMLGQHDTLFQYGLRGSDALVGRLPTVTSTHLGPGRNKLFLRGIADSSFNGPTQATVGQYLGETRLNYNAPDPDLRLYDLERIEILVGPQGTLYGAGSLGGIIRLVPNAPALNESEIEASVGVSATQHGEPGYDAGGMVNLPLSSDRLALRVVGYGASEGGYIDNPQLGAEDVNRTDIVGGRAALRGRAGESWTVDLGATVQQIDGAAQFADRDGPPLTRSSPVPQTFSNDYALGDLVVTGIWGDTRFVTATGIVRQVLRERYDSTRNGGPATVFEQDNRITLLSAESRLSRQSASGAGWLVGASLIRNVSEQSRALGAPAAPTPITGVRNAVTEATLYGEASFRLVPGVLATAGGRLTHSRLSGGALDVPIQVKQALFGVQATRNATAFLPSFSLSGHAAPDLLLFARYQEGFRPGGLAVSGSIVQRFRSDHIRTAEAGFRYGHADSAFDAAVSLAYTSWTDIQADIVDFAGMPTTANIGDGRIYTVDLRAGWRPLDGLGIELAAALNESEVTNPVPTIIIAPSSPLPNVARFNGRAAARYDADLSDHVHLRLETAIRYVGRSRLGIGPILGQEHGDWLDASVGGRIDFARHGVALSVTNLFDTVGNRFALGSPFTLIERPQVTPLRPRTVRLGWEIRF